MVIAGSLSPSAEVGQDLYQDAILALSEGRVSDARAVLVDLGRKEPDTPGAWLDLATLRCSLGDADEANRLFKEIEDRFFPPPEILGIINQQRASGCQSQGASAQVAVRLGRGFATNPNQGISNPNISLGSGSNRIDLVVSPDFRPKSGQYTFFSAEYSRELSFLENSNGFVSFRTRRYDELSGLDTTSILVGAERSWLLERWRLKGMVAAATALLGDRPYLNQWQLQLQVVPPAPLPGGWQYFVTTGWLYSIYPSFPEFNSNIFELRNSIRYQVGNVSLQGSVGLMLDRQSNERPGGARKGYFTSLDTRIPLSEALIAELGWQHQHWRAHDVFSPGLIDENRKQVTQQFRAGLSFSLSQNQTILTEYQYTDNRENISLFRYRDQMVQVSWQYRFGK